MNNVRRITPLSACPRATEEILGGLAEKYQYSRVELLEVAVKLLQTAMDAQAANQRLVVVSRSGEPIRELLLAPSQSKPQG